MDIDGLAKVYLQHKPKVIRFLRYKFPGVDDELLYDAYAEAWDIATVKQRSVVHPETGVTTIVREPRLIHLKTFRTFLTSIARNKVLDYLKAKRRGDDALDRASESLHDRKVLDQVDQLHQVQQPADTQYEQAMASLPPSLRLVAELHFVDGLTQKEVATKLGVGRTWVWMLINKARKLLRDWYRR